MCSTYEAESHDGSRAGTLRRSRLLIVVLHRIAYDPMRKTWEKVVLRPSRGCARAPLRFPGAFSTRRISTRDLAHTLQCNRDILASLFMNLKPNRPVPQRARRSPTPHSDQPYDGFLTRRTPWLKMMSGRLGPTLTKNFSSCSASA